MTRKLKKWLRNALARRATHRPKVTVTVTLNVAATIVALATLIATMAQTGCSCSSGDRDRKPSPSAGSVLGARPGQAAHVWRIAA